ncbi:protein methyltransferase FrzF [Myxococcus stipitatus DSM 14675]|uniref:protein-glutamate O-methyltransferase n=1 Tax=Myxococcus stipitatus (strain DSM 14675 / JCM 12634 / Mx s8) TaxID=1278073 RepID=L7UB69_MYXSD|nr:protein-glutamate O-methyltransferase [Myxococcus stipitatus]AGC45120.1 protein methyltransferase FrzF [Myxococcus stipitatus DSM 14675]
MLNVSNKVLQQLAALLLERAGLKITPDGFHSLRLALSTRMPVLGVEEPERYLQRLNGPGGEEELRSLLPLVTVGHTEFFRDAKQFRALEKSVLPDLLARARREMRKVSVWSAGCATGEEPYSVAMVLAELGALSVEVDLWATDLNLAAVEAARQGRFSQRRAISINPERLSRFFRPVEDGYEALTTLREYIRFDGQNLAVPVFDKVALGSLDLILCRNVIIYFDLPTIRGLMDRFLAALRPGGLLFLGYSESLFKVYDRFEMIEVDGAFVYRRPPSDRGVRPPPLRIHPYPGTGTQEPRAPEPEPFSPAVYARPPVDGAAQGVRPRTAPVDTSVRGPGAMSGTFSTVGTPPAASATVPVGTRSNDLGRPRITVEIPAVGAVDTGRTRPTVELPSVQVSPRAASPGEPSALAAWPKLLPPAERLAMAVRKMTQGDFPGAIAGVERLLVDEPSDLDALLTLGNLYSLTGRIPEAREAFAQAILREPLCVEARVFGGVAALQAGELKEARSELGKALFLEPTLAIGHYLLAQVQERSHESDSARRSYRNAIAQLRFPQRTLAGHYPEMPDSAEAISRAARYALAALEEQPPH